MWNGREGSRATIHSYYVGHMHDATEWVHYRAPCVVRVRVRARSCVRACVHVCVRVRPRMRPHTYCVMCFSACVRACVHEHVRARNRARSNARTRVRVCVRAPLAALSTLTGITLESTFPAGDAASPSATHHTHTHMRAPA